MRWTYTPLPSDEIEALSKTAGVSRVLAELLLRGGHREAASAASFLQPGLASLNDPFLLRNLCPVGLVFKLAYGLLKQLRTENHPVAFRIKLRDYLDFVAMGTIADLVPLLGENRILARHGLRILQGTVRPGLRALMDVAGL